MSFGSGGRGKSGASSASPANGVSQTFESSGAPTTGAFSNSPVRPPSRWCPVAPREANTTAPVGLVPVTRTWFVRLPGASTSASTDTAVPLSTVDTNCVVIQRADRCDTRSAAVIETAIAVPP